jgi:hypothetical protein
VISRCDCGSGHVNERLSLVRFHRVRSSARLPSCSHPSTESWGQHFLGSSQVRPDLGFFSACVVAARPKHLDPPVDARLHCPMDGSDCLQRHITCFQVSNSAVSWPDVGARRRLRVGPLRIRRIARRAQ